MDKQIHRDEFRLRLLITNTCNRNCYHCLNDFQDKEPPQFLPTDMARVSISEYEYLCTDLSLIPTVSFSGGEPTLHRDFSDILLWADRNTGCRLQVNTNGLRMYDVYRATMSPQISWRFGTDICDSRLLQIAKSVDGIIQIVMTDKNAEDVLHIVRYYYDKGLRVKLFIDMFGTAELKHRYETIDELKDIIGLDNLQFRYTGIQENRGAGCLGCKKDCITLKAAWVFPDGSITPCPQKHKGKVYSMNTLSDLKIALRECYKFHKVKLENDIPYGGFDGQALKLWPEITKNKG